MKFWLRQGFTNPDFESLGWQMRREIANRGSIPANYLSRAPSSESPPAI
jgi:hypothetical protein